MYLCDDVEGRIGSRDGSKISKPAERAEADVQKLQRRSKEGGGGLKVIEAVHQEGEDYHV